MAVDKEVKKRQLAGNFNQQKVFTLVKMEGAEMPTLSTPKKFVISRSDVSGKYEIEARKATSTSDSTKQLSSWNNQAAAGEEPISWYPMRTLGWSQLVIVYVLVSEVYTINLLVYLTFLYLYQPI